MQVKTIVADPIGIGFGGISGGELSAESGEELAEQVEQHLVPVDENAPSCCIDGRPSAECMDGSKSEPRPSLAGGALITAYAAAEITGWFGEDGGNTATRLGRIHSILTAKGIKAGNHCDTKMANNNFWDPKQNKALTGCGADDKLPEILQQPYEHPSAVTAITSVALDQEFNAKYMHFVDQKEVRKHIAEWLPTDVINILGAKTANNIEILIGDHEEVAVVFNYHPGTTLDRDEFVKDTGEQVFVVDMWYIDKVAKAMATGPSASEQYEQLKHAMVAYQAATYLTLCDGTQRPILIK